MAIGPGWTPVQRTAEELRELPNLRSVIAGRSHLGGESLSKIPTQHSPGILDDLLEICQSLHGPCR